MASITLKNIPEHLHAIYKRRAAAHHRRLQAEIYRTLALHASGPEGNNSVSIDDVAGMLKPRRKGVRIEDMKPGVDRMFQESWK